MKIPTGKYARMYLKAAGMEQSALEELSVVNALIKESPDFRSLLENPAFSNLERTKGIEGVCQKAGLSSHTELFIKFLSDQNATGAMREVLSKAVAMYLESNNKAKATVITPVGVGTAYDDRIKAALGKVTGKEVEVEYMEDASLLGGVLIKVGSTMFDASIKGQLRLLKDDLNKGVG